ncbi:transglycosylase SLT domain-containing protein [Escherichia coli]
MWRVLLLVTGLLWLPPAGAWCFRQAGERYQIDPLLLQAIAIKESRLNTRAIGYNRDERRADNQPGLWPDANQSATYPVIVVMACSPPVTTADQMPV